MTKDPTEVTCQVGSQMDDLGPLVHVGVKFLHNPHEICTCLMSFVMVQGYSEDLMEELCFFRIGQKIAIFFSNGH